MRLLDARALIYGGESRLVNDQDVGNPHYAILSHTWREEEVLFEDIALGPNYEVATVPNERRMKEGYRLDSRLRAPAKSFLTWPREFLTKHEYMTADSSEGVCSRCQMYTGLLPPTGKTHVKIGWTKVLKTCMQACRDGYDYVWIDTCCIDKSSSAELSEALNSMFKWYEESAVCYVQLDDCNLCPEVCVDKPSRSTNQLLRNISVWMKSQEQLGRCTIAQILQCRWLTRGWTLQELLAPRKVWFFDREWKFICDLPTIRHLLSNLTGIDERILDPPQFFLLEPYREERKKLLKSFTIAERMSWAANRVTTRVEDKAYCLLGLFDINMPLLYGEGENALIRLQEEIIRYSTDESILA